ncbi:MAG: CRISPR-associated endonuclease Cas1 [Candidatus Hodarchaeota archaeon]
MVKFGTNISKTGRTLIVQTEDFKRELAVKKLSRCFLGPGVRISTDALLLALQYEVDIIICDQYGQPVGRVTPTAFHGPVITRIAQLELTMLSKAFDMIVKLLYTKMFNQKSVLQHFGLTYSLDLFENLLDQISSSKPDGSLDSLIALEGQAAKIYFSELGLLLDQTWYQRVRSRRPPKDPFNSLLSYGYGILFSRVERECLSLGLDPYIGLLHVPRYGRRSLVLDLMEPFRPLLVDYAVIQSFLLDQMSKEYFILSETSCLLNAAGKKACVKLIQDQGDKIPSILARDKSIFQEIKGFVKQFHLAVRQKSDSFLPPIWRDQNDLLDPL